MSTSGQFIYTEELYRLPKRVLIVLPVAWAILTDDELTLLKKILTSVRISIDSTQVIVHQEITVEAIQAFAPSVVIAFGAKLLPSITSYQSSDIDGIRVIQSDALGQLDDVKKKNLWNALKQAFSA